MSTNELVLDNSRLRQLFEECCNKYSKLRFAVAWCGRPNDGSPYSYLRSFKGSISGIVGRAFNQSHPDGIRELHRLCKQFRIVTPSEATFHPKIYLFENSDQITLFVGSNNFTSPAFVGNNESMSIIVGKRRELLDILHAFNEQFDRWMSDRFSISFSKQWLHQYEIEYHKTDHYFKTEGLVLKEPADAEVTYWLKPWGDPDDPVPSGKQFDEEMYNLDFGVKPSGVKIGDIMIVYGIGWKKVFGVFKVLSGHSEYRKSELRRMGKPKYRWTWHVAGLNLTRKFGRTWEKGGIYYFPLEEKFAKLKPRSTVTLWSKSARGTIKSGSNYCGLSDQFAHFVFREINRQTGE